MNRRNAMAIVALAMLAVLLCRPAFNPAAAQPGNPAAPSPSPAARPVPPYPSAPAAGAAADAPVAETLRLADLGAAGDVVLRGVNPSSSLFLPIDEDGELVDLRFNLRLSHSAVLTADSTLTLRLNGEPVASLRLTPENIRDATWSVTAPVSSLKGEFVTVTFAAYLRISDESCRDLENAATWVTVGQDSTIEATALRGDVRADLGRFPYPLLRLRSPRPSTALLVLPDAGSGEDWAAIMPLAATLGGRAAPRPFQLYAISERDLTPTLAGAYHLIIAGRSGQLRWLEEQARTLPLRRSGNGALLDAAGVEIAPDTGVIMTAVSPWSARHAVLILTGTTTEAVRRAVAAAGRPGFSSLARGNVALAPEMVRDEPAGGLTDWNARSLASLGVSDLVVQGLGRQSVDLTIELPPRGQAQDAEMTIQLSHSPFVSTDRSFLNLFLNDIPVKGVFLTADNEDRSAWRLTLPAGRFRPGRNLLRFVFELHLARGEDCARLAIDQAWAVIHQDSWLTVRFGEGGGARTVDLAMLPAPFGEGALVVIPDAPEPNERAGGILLMAQLGRELGDRARMLRVTTAASAERPALQGEHVILLGRPENNRLISEVGEALPYQSSRSGRTLRGGGGSLTIDSGAAVGVVQQFPSPWNANRTALLISGVHDQSVGWAALLLTDPERRAQLRGNVAVIDAAGILTTLDTRAPAPAPRGRVAGSRPTPGWVAYVLAGSLALIVLVLGLLLARRTWLRGQ